MKKLGGILLYPFSLIYGLVISSRNILYDTGLLKETSFNLPIINVGNLSVGGAGKTPHVEYLIQLLQPYLEVAILSRGYKRKSKGFRLVKREDTALVSGDEPLQYKRKYPGSTVAVSESRALGIPQLVKHNPKIQTILLDDAFQHRSVKASLNILITPQHDLYIDDLLLPAGRLRENPEAASRADLIIVSKCDDDLSRSESQRITDRLEILPHQKVYYSKYTYGNPYFILNSNQKINLNPDLDIILISAIANTSYLLKYLEQKTASINSMEYEDHRNFNDRDMQYLLKVYQEASDGSMIITTEKDAIRLQDHKQFIIEHNLPIFALPASVEFLFDNKTAFNNHVKDFLKTFQV